MDFVEPSGSNPILRWLSGLPTETQAHIAARFLLMEGMLRWPDKWVSDYKGYDGILELRIPFNRVQYRPLMAYAPDRKIILLGGAIEKGGKIPKGDLDAADQRRKLLLKEPNLVVRHRF